MALVHIYSKAFATREIDAMIRVTHPVLILRSGGEANYRRELEVLFAQMSEAKVWPAEELLGEPSRMYVNGNTQAFSVPVLRKTAVMITPLDYVVISYDSGKSWKLIDLLCTDERWLKAMLPGYAGVPDLLPVHPEAPKDYLSTQATSVPPLKN